MDIVKLLVCYHKPSYLLKDEIFTPIHVGRALAAKSAYRNPEAYEWLMENMIGDDTGDNISEKNGSYNEMTSLYWAWKNYDALGNPDYIGLMHYRRHFVLRPGAMDVIHFDALEEDTYFEEINYSPEKMYALVEGCDFVTHIGKVENVYRHYLENHRREDLDTALEIMYTLYPEYKEVAAEYLEGSLSNFCNMFIFSRKLFFEYCEWIFSILAEFEKRVDIREKRFFISERLSGIFIAKLMKDTELKYKVVPISFVAEHVTVPLVMPYERETEFRLAVTMISLLKNKAKNSRYSIRLLCEPGTDKAAKDRFEKLVSAFGGCDIQFVETDTPPEYGPFVLEDLFLSWNKCIWLTDKVLVLKDLTEFYRTCSVDDYYVVGAPLEEYDIYSADKKVRLDFLVLNLGRLRGGAQPVSTTSEIVHTMGAEELFQRQYSGKTGYVPWYYITVADSKSDGIHLFDKGNSRGRLQADALWKPIMLYEGEGPWCNPQDVFSLFWWEMASFVPASFRFPAFNPNILRGLFAQQQQEINQIGTLVKTSGMRKTSGSEKALKQDSAEPVPGEESWREYSLLGKLAFYYQHNGLKNTISYCCRKYIWKGR